MKKKIKYFLVLLVLLFLSINVVNDSNNTTHGLNGHTLEKTTQNMEKVATSTQEQIHKENTNNINTTVTEKRINKISTKENRKTATSIDISDYTKLHNTLTSSASDDVTINLQADITLEGNTTVNTAIKTLTINGFHYTIYGDGQYQFLTIRSGSSVNINNITITNCEATTGGAIYNEGNVTITDSTLTHNNAIQGGAIFNFYNGTMILNNNTLQNNNASSGGSIFNYYTNMTLTHNTLQNNNASSGGSIFNYYANMTLNNNTLQNNNADLGGAIYNYYNATMTLNNNTLQNNNASSGGAIYNYYNTTMTLNNNTLQNNNASTGGDIFNESSTVIVQDSSFINTFPTAFLINKNVILDDSGNYIPESSPVDIYVDGEDKGTYQLTNKIIEDFTVPLGNHTLKLTVQGTNDNYSNNAYILNYLIFTETQTNLEIINNTVGNTVVNVTVHDENGELINNESIIITDEYGQIIAMGYINQNNESILRLDLPYGEHNITATHPENPAYGQSSNTTTIKVKHKTNIKIDVINPVEDNLTAIITISDENNQPAKQEKVNITLPNGTIIEETTDDKGEISLIGNASIGLQTITAQKTENENYSNATLTQQTYITQDYQKIIDELNNTIQELQDTIDKLQAVKNTTLSLDEITDAKYNNEIIITGTLVNEDSIGLFNQAVTLTIGETEVNLTTKSGMFEYKTSFKELGEKTVTASYAGNDKYQASDASITFNVEKQDIIITVDPISVIKYKDNVTISGKVTDVNGKGLYNINAIIKINGKLFKARTDKNGTFKFSKPANPAGINNVTISYNGNANYNGYSTNTTFIVEKQNITITVDPIPDVKYKNNVTISGKITDIHGRGLNNIGAIITINGRVYKATTDKSGAFIITETIKTIGINNVTVSYGGTANYNGYSTNITFNVEKQNITISINPRPDTVYNDNITISGKIIDLNGNVLKNINALIKVNAKLYKAKTDSTGTYLFTTPATTLGTNNVTVGYGGNSYYNSFESVTTFNVIAKRE